MGACRGRYAHHGTVVERVAASAGGPGAALDALNEIADAVMWMISPTATYLVVDGGTDALVRPDQF